MVTHDEFLRHLHRALYHLYEPDRLRRNPLAALLGVANRLDTFSALQRMLVEAISSLEPGADEPPQSGAWEIYEPLYHRFVQQLDQRQVARQLGMSVRHLRRKEHAAVEVLAGRLMERYGLQDRLQTGTAEERSPEVPARNVAISEELAWLRDASPESPTDAEQALREVLRLGAPLAGRYAVRLEVSQAQGLPAVAAHPLALSQALADLLSVAIHQSPGGVVRISASHLQAEVAFEVRSLSSRTQAMTEEDAASLELARQLAGLCRGKLTLRDDLSAFHARLTIPALEQLPVLVIDDNADTLQLLQRYAVDTRYRLIATQDPEQAVQLAARYSPRIVVLDVMMPRVDGWKVLAHLCEHPATEGIPVVVCTILAQAEMALALGASGFVRKPVTRQAFLHALDQVLQDSVA